MLIAIGLGAASINTGNNLLYLVFAITLSMIVLSGILSEMDIVRMKAGLVQIPDITVNDTGFATVRLKNRRRLLQGLSLQVRLEITGTGVDVTDGFVSLIKPGQAMDVTIKIKGLRRGPYTVSAIHVYTSFPFSFFQKGLVYNIENQALVLPAPLPVDMAPVYALKKGQNHPASGLGRQGEFWGIREFRQGDDPKAIHQRLSARMNKPMVREFTDMGNPRLTLGIRNVGRPEDVENAISRAAFMVSMLLDRGWVVRLTDMDRTTGWLAGNEGLRLCLRFLAQIKNPSAKPADIEADLWVN